MDIHRLILSETPEPSDSLINLLETIIQSNESCISAMLPIHAIPTDGRLANQDIKPSIAEINQLFLFCILAIRSANLDGPKMF